MNQIKLLDVRCTKTPRTDAGLAKKPTLFERSTISANVRYWRIRRCQCKHFHLENRRLFVLTNLSERIYVETLIHNNRSLMRTSDGRRLELAAILSVLTLCSSRLPMAVATDYRCRKYQIKCYLPPLSSSIRRMDIFFFRCTFFRYCERFNATAARP